MKKLIGVLVLSACGELPQTIGNDSRVIKPLPEPEVPVVSCTAGSCPRDLYDPWIAFPEDLGLAYDPNEYHATLPNVTRLAIKPISFHVYAIELEINGRAQMYFTDNTSALTEYRYVMRNASMTSESGFMIKGFRWVSETKAQVELCRFITTFTNPTQCLTLEATYQ